MLYPEMIELLSCDIFYLRKSAQSVDKISDENPQISKERSSQMLERKYQK